MKENCKSSFKKQERISLRLNTFDAGERVGERDTHRLRKTEETETETESERERERESRLRYVPVM